MRNLFSKLQDYLNGSESGDYDYEYDEMEGGNYSNLYPTEPPVPAPTESIGNRSRLRDRPTASSSTAPFSPAPLETGTSPNSSLNNVIGLPGATNGISEVVVMEPRSFEEMPQAIQALRERKSVVLNLTVMDPDQAQRAVDFIAGGTFALDGHQERIGESIFLFTPSCVQVSTQSGVVRDVMQPHLRAPRPTAPAGTPSNWSADLGRMAQS
ncbi:MAG: cell division protein SepF [Cyanobacteria bacterium SID2]|nr:cell division protein SepF [Cyanobacteria bacterium SID2]MBP0004640.1 cell division protein SepF [Cyanobacteria bacterium SBC]